MAFGPKSAGGGAGMAGLAATNPWAAAGIAGLDAAGNIASGLSGGPSGASGGHATAGGGNVFNTGPGHRQMPAGFGGLGITPQTASIGLIVLALGVYVWNQPS